MLLLSCFLNYVHPPDNVVRSFGSRGPNPECDSDGETREHSEQIDVRLPATRGSPSRSRPRQIYEDSTPVRAFPHLNTMAYHNLMEAVSQSQLSTVTPTPAVLYNFNGQYNQLQYPNVPASSVPPSFPYVQTPSYNSSSVIQPILTPNPEPVLTPHQRRIMEMNRRFGHHFNSSSNVTRDIHVSLNIPFQTPEIPQTSFVQNSTMAIPGVLPTADTNEFTMGQQSTLNVHIRPPPVLPIAMASSSRTATVASSMWSIPSSIIDPADIRREKARERKRKQREIEAQKRTEEQKRLQAEAAATQKKKSRANETSKQTQGRLEKNRIKTNNSRINETVEERSARLSKDSQAHAESRANETSEQRQERHVMDAEAHAKSRANETPEQREERLAMDAEAHVESRANETPEQREERLARDAAAHMESRAGETPEQIQSRYARINSSRNRNRANLPLEELLQIREADAAVQRQRRADMTHSQLAQVNARRRNNYHRRQEELRNRTLFIAELPYRLPPHHLGPMSSECCYCGALYFAGEGTETNGGTYDKCCNHARFDIPLFTDYPEELRILMTNIHPMASNFHANIRQFNNALAMASMEAKIKAPPGRGCYVFRVHGTIVHQMGPAIPQNGNPSYGQFYFLDTAQAADERIGRRPNVNCSPPLMRMLSDVMARDNVLARSYKLMGEVYREEEAKAIAQNAPVPTMKMVFYMDKTKDQRRYNAPITNEVAGIFVGPDGEVPTPRQYTVFLRNGRFTRLDVTNPKLDPMTYPLFWPTGRDSWHPNMWKYPRDGLSRSRVTQSDYYGYLLSIRHTFNPIHHSGKLLQQFAVDVWLRMEQNKLEWARHNQDKLRSELYQNLGEFVGNESDGLAGTRVILPSSTIGSPRNFAQEYQDTMTMVSKFGKPDYFLTFTCNPKWDEIVENLYPGQDASDRPDLVSRVFNMKLKALMKDVVEGRIFGEVLCYAFTIEWQKRGLPHAHLLITVASQHKPNTPEKVDRLISAEIPDPMEEPELYNIVKTHMIHRRCGATDPNAPCMKDGKCNKKFPKPFATETSMDGHGYPVYRRRDSGITITTTTNGTTQTYTNTHVVPYNKWLLAKYKCHINVEICSLLHACKYIYKYVYKGSDKATVELRKQVCSRGGNVDEITEHLDARYICPPEALHRIFGNKIQDRSHSVDHLQVHLPENQRVSFQPGQEQQALNKAATERTNLIAYFALNQEWYEKEQRGEDLGPVDPRTLHYTDIPNHFVFKKVNGVDVWAKRDRGGSKKIGRMFGVTLKERERFCLRQLLLKRKGARSYEDLRTMNGIVFPNFERAAVAMGLLNHGDCIAETMNEACQRQMPFQIRKLFASLLLFFVPPTDKAMSLWLQYAPDMSEDYTRRGRNALDATALAWYDIDDMLLAQNMEFKDFVPAPLPQRPAAMVEDDPVDHSGIGHEMRLKLNAEQERVVAQILSGNVRLAFVDGPGGCGKTFVYRTIYHVLKGEGKTVICAAFTGIAASLLPDGRTLCSLFKLNPNNDNRTSSISPNSKEGAILREMDTLILDEISMISAPTLSIINKVLQDVSNNTEPFGGKRVLMGGDFRQVLPIPPKNSGMEPYEISLKNSDIFPLFTKFQLVTNMRASTESEEWKEYLLRIGNGTEEENQEGKVVLPREILSAGDLIQEIYQGVFDDADHLQSRAILTARNRRVNEINDDILSSMDGNNHTYYSFDQQELDDESDQLEVSQEFMHTQTPAGFPLHALRLKIGCVIMLIRNLNIRSGLCNGTRLQVTSLGRNLITAAHIVGPRKGEEVLIPRIDIISNNGALSIKMRRTQFPIKLAFCMSINKAQGQSLESVGIDLEEEVFSHGQLYVALSRSKTQNGVKVYTKDGLERVRNVVDRRVLE